MEKDIKVYSNFSDKFGNNYKFNSYVEFASFWFNLSRKVAISYFPDFKKLQRVALYSKEARAVQ